MKSLFYCLTLLFFAAKAIGQEPQFLFTADGKLKSPFPAITGVAEKLKVKVDNFAEFSFSRQAGKDEYNLDRTVNAQAYNLSADDITAARAMLAARINQSLANLHRNPLIDSFYLSEYGNAFTDMVAELSRLSDELTGTGAIDARTYTHLKDICKLENDLHADFNPFHATAKFNSVKKKYEITVSKDDRLRSLMRTYIQAKTNGLALKTLALNNAYKSAWQQIRALAERGVQIDSLLKKAVDPRTGLSCDEQLHSPFPEIESFTTRDIADAWQNNLVLRTLDGDKASLFPLFWLTGAFSTNPIGVTTPDRMWLFPSSDTMRARLRDAVIMQKIREQARCCTGSTAALDSMLAQIDKGKQHFLIIPAADSAFGYTSVKALRTDATTIHAFRWPVVPDNTDLFVYTYDASDNYRTPDLTAANNTLKSTEKATLCIINIPAGKTVSIDQKNTVIPNTSPVLEPLGDIATLLSVVGALPGKFPLPDWSPAQPQPVQPVNIPTPAVPSRDESFKSARLILKFKDEPNTIPHTPDMTPRQLINRYLNIINKSDELQPLADYFFDSCYHNSDTRISPENYLAESDRIIKQFNTFAKANKTRLQLASDFHHALSKILFLNGLTDKSLPPTDLSSLTGKAADFRSDVDPLNVPDSTIMINYTITPKDKKPDPAADPSPENQPVTGSLLVGKAQLLQLSVGIAATFADYYQKTATSSASGLSVNTNSNHLSYTAGLHIYFLKRILLLDNSFMGISSGRWHDRISGYLGVSITDPLKHYYLGLGDDLLPGLKLVAGAHFFLNNRYTVASNQVLDQASGVKYSGLFISLNLDPATIIKTLGISK